MDIKDEKDEKVDKDSKTDKADKDVESKIEKKHRKKSKKEKKKHKDSKKSKKHKRSRSHSNSKSRKRSKKSKSRSTSTSVAKRSRSNSIRSRGSRSASRSISRRSKSRSSSQLRRSRSRSIERNRRSRSSSFKSRSHSHVSNKNHANNHQRKEDDHFTLEEREELRRKRLVKTWAPFSKEYDPLQSGSIDGTDSEPHDRAISRAMEAHFIPPHGLKSKPERTLMVARFGPEITDENLKDFFTNYGEVVSAKVILDVVTGHSMCYGFVEMKSIDDAYKISNKFHDIFMNGYKIFVDMEIGRTMKGWKPRRLGGGFGGKKESGQLRFGGKDRPFKKPISLEMVKYM